MSKIKCFLGILIISTMAQQALAGEVVFFRPGRILISAEYQSLLPSCNSYNNLQYPQALFEYCVSKTYSLGLGVGYGTREHPGYLRKQNGWSMEASAFINYRIAGKFMKGILGMGIVWIPNLKTARAKATLGIRLILAKSIATHGKILFLKTNDRDFGIGYALGLTFAFR
jgi:hypothetical protein